MGDQAETPLEQLSAISGVAPPKMGTDDPVNLAVLQYQVVHLTAIVTAGFTEQRTTGKELATRVSKIETWIEGRERAEAAMADKVHRFDQRWIPLTICAITAATALFVALITSGTIVFH